MIGGFGGRIAYRMGLGHMKARFEAHCSTPRRCEFERKLVPLVLSGLVFVWGCEAEVTHSNVKVDRKKTAPSASVSLDADAGPPRLSFKESEFMESAKSRDPFRSFSTLFAEEARSEGKRQRPIVLEQYTIDELKLIGIVTRIHPAKAMLEDPTGMGHVIQRGQLVGRPETVHAGATSGQTYQVPWRVDRIRKNDVVFVREDPENPDVPATTRVVPLRPETE